MTRILNWICGYYIVAVCGVAPQDCLNRLTGTRIPFWNVEIKDEFSLNICIRRGNFSAVFEQAARAQCEASVVRECGAPRRYRGLRHRAVFLVLLCAAVTAALILPRFVWFYRVEGNVTIPDAEIIRVVQSCGVGIGTYGKSIVPQVIKDRVLAQLPALSWLTIQQSGCCATIVVREKEQPQIIVDRKTPQNIVASYGGLIEEVSVLDGSASVKPGDIVSAGEILISAYVDLEYKIRLAHAMGEVYARTWHENQAVTPMVYYEKAYTGEVDRVVYLVVGRKQIKISSGSGIFTMECDKMTKSRTLTLPGGYSLPVTLVVETYRYFRLVPAKASAEEAETMMLRAVEERTKAAMTAGQILQVKSSLAVQPETYLLHTVLECKEMIGQPSAAEIFKDD